MTIIFTNSDFHIESHLIPATLVNFGFGANVTITLDKGGRFAGGTVTMGRVANTDRVTVKLQTVAGITLLYGDAIVDVRARFFNSDAATNETAAEAYLLILIRK